MKRIIFNACIFFLLQNIALADPSKPLVSDKASVLAVQTFRVKPYEQAVEGFGKAVRSKMHNMCLCDTPLEDILSHIAQRRPDLILTVGLNALTGVMTVKDFPIVYLMVLDPPQEVLHSKNIFGVSMMIHPEDQLDIVNKTMPWIKSIGIIYDSETSGAFIQLARASAANRNIFLMDRKIEGGRKFIDDLNAICNQIDAFWMLPDVRLLTSENIEYLLLMSVEKKIPIITFSEKFVELGAFMALSVDATDLGQQAGILAQQILAKPGNGVEHIIFPEKAIVTINAKVLKNLNIQFNSDQIEHLNIIK